MGSKVVFKTRTFDTSCYTPLKIYTNNENETKARNLCQHYCDEDVRFSTLQMMTCFTTWSFWKNDRKTTFCSKLIASILIDAGIVPVTFERSLTPSHLYRNLKQLEAQSSAKHEVIDFLPGGSISLRI